jgi:hypothetical protein
MHPWCSGWEVYDPWHNEESVHRKCGSPVWGIIIKLERVEHPQSVVSFCGMLEPNQCKEGTPE